MQRCTQAGHWRRSTHLEAWLTWTTATHAKLSLLYASQLRHPNIVRFLGACIEPERMFILFELCPGSLFDLLYKSDSEVRPHLLRPPCVLICPPNCSNHDSTANRAQLPEAKYIFRLLRDVGLGIYYLHCFEPPVLHLDLKSANVLLDQNGVAKVLLWPASASESPLIWSRRNTSSPSILLVCDNAHPPTPNPSVFSASQVDRWRADRRRSVTLGCRT